MNKVYFRKQMDISYVSSQWSLDKCSAALII